MGDLCHAAQKEGEPALPIARVAHGLEAVIVFGAIALEVVREIEDRTGKSLPLGQQKSDEQAAQTTIAVEEG